MSSCNELGFQPSIPFQSLPNGRSCKAPRAFHSFHLSTTVEGWKVGARRKEKQIGLMCPSNNGTATA